MPSLVILRQALESEEPPKQEVIVTGLQDYHKLGSGSNDADKHKRNGSSKHQNNNKKGLFRLLRSSAASPTPSTASTATASTVFSVEEQDEEQAMLSLFAQDSPPVVTLKQKRRAVQKQKGRRLVYSANQSTRHLASDELDAAFGLEQEKKKSRSQPNLLLPQLQQQPQRQLTDPGDEQPPVSIKKIRSTPVAKRESAAAAAINTTATRRSSVPNPGAYSNNHLMVNRERVVRGLGVLQRSAELDRRASRHAERLADEGQLGHSVASLAQLQKRLRSPNVGENVFGGRSIREMHVGAMQEGTSSRFNVLRPSYTEFGMGTAVGKNKHENDGIDDEARLYMVQLFRGGEREEL